MKKDNGTQSSDVGLTLSDWITFLSNEKSSGLGNVIGAATVFITVFVVFQRNGFAPISSALRADYPWLPYVQAAAIVLLGGLFIWLVLRVVKVLSTPAAKAEKLLDSIMRGDERFRTEQQIRAEWIRLNPKKKNLNHKRQLPRARAGQTTGHGSKA